MKALLWMPFESPVPGGHRVQLEQTALTLRDRGVEVTIEHGVTWQHDGYDVVHGFGLSRQQIRACRVGGAKIVISTIYWSLDYTQNQRSWPTRLLFGLALMRASLKGRYREKCRSMTQTLNELRTTYEMADLLLPNSESEAECVRRELGVTTPMHIVPNAVDDALFTPPLPGAERPIDVLFRGRFEPHKNQLGFLRAMKGTGLRIVLAGPAHPDHPAYYEQCRQEATGSISVAPPVPQHDLPTLYRQAKVHALPSWYETTGLVSLEAALCGCKIVTTARGFASDYFGNLASYCDPGYPATIRAAINSSLRLATSEVLRNHILSHFTWKHAAEATCRAYVMANKTFKSSHYSSLERGVSC